MAKSALSNLIEAASGRWPNAVANLKALLENVVIALQQTYPAATAGLGPK